MTLSSTTAVDLTTLTHCAVVCRAAQMTSTLGASSVVCSWMLTRPRLSGLDLVLTYSQEDQLRLFSPSESGRHLSQLAWCLQACNGDVKTGLLQYSTGRSATGNRSTTTTSPELSCSLDLRAEHWWTCMSATVTPNIYHAAGRIQFKLLCCIVCTQCSTGRVHERIWWTLLSQSVPNGRVSGLRTATAAHKVRRTCVLRRRSRCMERTAWRLARHGRQLYKSLVRPRLEYLETLS